MSKESAAARTKNKVAWINNMNQAEFKEYFFKKLNRKLFSDPLWDALNRKFDELCAKDQSLK